MMQIGAKGLGSEGSFNHSIHYGGESGFNRLGYGDNSSWSLE